MLSLTQIEASAIDRLDRNNMDFKVFKGWLERCREDALLLFICADSNMIERFQGQVQALTHIVGTINNLPAELRRLAEEAENVNTDEGSFHEYP